MLLLAVTLLQYSKDNGEYDYDYFKRSKEVSSDILLDSFGNGVISLSGDETRIPKDRTTNESIKVGTMFHNISTTCVVPFYVDELHATGILSGPDTTVDDQTSEREILAHTGGDSIVTK